MASTPSHADAAPEPPRPGLRRRLLLGLAAFVCRRALWIVLAALLLAGLSVWLSVTSLTFITDRNALVDPEAEFNKRFLRFNAAFGDQELMLLCITAAPGPVNNPDFDPPPPTARQRAEMKQAAAKAARALRARPELFPRVMERVDPESFGGTRMLYMPLKDLEGAVAQVEAAKPLIARVAQEPGLPGLLRGLRENIDQGSVSNLSGEQLDRAGAELATLIKSLRESLDPARPALAPDGLFAFNSSDPNLDPDGYFFTWEGRMLFVPLLPAKDHAALNQVKEPIAFARAALAEVQREHPGLSLGLTGRPAIYSDEMETSNRDMTNATILALLSVTILFALWFRGLVRPALGVLSLVLALCWTMGFTTLALGHLNIFAMVFGVVLIGLGIDFAIHVLNHYRHGLARGLSVREALYDCYAEIGAGTVTGAVTTAAALSTAMLTDFLGLAELGLICGVGILFCLLSMLVVLPAMLVLYDRRRLDEGDRNLREVMRARALDEALHPLPQRTTPLQLGAAAVMLAAILAGVVSVSWAATHGWTPFDYDLLSLNDPSSEAVHWEQLLVRHDQRASYAVSLRERPEEIRALHDRFLPLVEQGVIRGMETIVPEHESQSRALLARLDAALPASFAGQDQPSDARAVQSAARALQAGLRTLAGRGENFGRAFGQAADEAAAMVELCRQSPEGVTQRLAQMEPGFCGALRKALSDLKRDASPPPVTPQTLPEVMRNRYVGHLEDGRPLYALYIYPRKNMWDHENAREFNRLLLAIDPEATGVTIQIQESADIIVNGFVRSVLYAALVILALIALDLRRPLATLISLLPLIGGLAILGGVMVFSGLSFNFANFFAVPILIGTTVDAGVYLVHSQRHGDPVRTLRQTRGACVLCSLTTALGFGTMMIAHHRGVISLGAVLTVGTFASMLVAFFLVPVVLGWFNAHGKRV